MCRLSDTSFSRGTTVLLSGGLLCTMVAAGCADAGRVHSTMHVNPCLIPDTRYSIPLSLSAGIICPWMEGIDYKSYLAAWEVPGIFACRV